MDTDLQDGVLGGWTKPQPPTPEVQEMLTSLKEAIEDKAGIFFDTFEVKTYSTQVATGTNYRIKVHVGDDMYIHVRLFENQKGKINLRSVKINKTDDDMF
ncbi:leukocyte cysteine proteinase inhibitor 1-like [Ptychodera flava]|uniref:leukocyte cysteine proteinase inhibitor 1-like n=1 Tax=Ptychodera flava TaxID=63121 RepID=UPI00396AAC46